MATAARDPQLRCILSLTGRSLGVAGIVPGDFPRRPICPEFYNSRSIERSCEGSQSHEPIRSWKMKMTAIEPHTPPWEARSPKQPVADSHREDAASVFKCTSERYNRV